MGIDWTDRECNLLIGTTTEYTYRGADYKIEWVYEITGKCAFITINRYYGGLAIKGYSKNVDMSLRANVSYTETKPTGISSSTSSQGGDKGTLINYKSANESFTESSMSDLDSTYKKFSDVLFNIENKWVSEFGSANSGCYYITMGNSGGAYSSCDSSGYIEYIKGNPTHTNRKDRGAIVDLTNYNVGEEPFPIYLENDNGNEYYFSSYANYFESVSTLVPVFNDGDGKLSNRARSDRHYVLMNLLDDYSKWSGGTQEKQYEERLDIYVNMDGTKKPNTNIHWKPTARYGADNDFSKYKFNIYTIGSGGESPILLGEFPLDSSETVTFSYKEMLGGRVGGDEYLQLTFNSNWLSNDYTTGDKWIATIYNDVSDFSDNYEKLSIPNGIPELHLTVNEKSGDDGDNKDNGDGGEDGGGGSGGGSGVNPHSLLTTTYILNVARTQQLGNVLWSSSFLDNILLLNNSPIENILSLKLFPFTFPSGTDSEIKLGNVPMGVNGQILPNSYSYSHTIGSVSIPKLYNSFLDFAPYTKVMLYLPYYGITELDCNEYMGRIMTVEYIIDVVVGSCLINVYVKNQNGINVLTNQFASQVGVDIPITSSNRAQVEGAIVANALKDVVTTDFGGLANDLFNAGFAKYHSSVNGSPSSSCGMYAYKNPMVIIDRPTYNEIGGFAHAYGRMCMQNKQIKSLTGFTKMSENIDLSNVPATITEIEEIKNILTSGFYA